MTARMLTGLLAQLHEMQLQAVECRRDDEFLAAVIAEEEAARLERRIAEIEALEEVNA